jgi:hypothetical protein
MTEVLTAPAETTSQQLLNLPQHEVGTAVLPQPHPASLPAVGIFSLPLYEITKHAAPMLPTPGKLITARDEREEWEDLLEMERGQAELESYQADIDTTAAELERMLSEQDNNIYRTDQTQQIFNDYTNKGGK